MGVTPSNDHRRRWEEKNVFVAGVLAYLIPGAGHFYQGRLFKGCIYFCCILGTFFGGMKLGEGAVVYNAPNKSWGVSLHYLAQVCVGLPALPAWQQARRAAAPQNRIVVELTEPLKAEFAGELVSTGPASDEVVGPLVGTIELATTPSGSVTDTRGRFVGTLDGKPIELELEGGFRLDRPVSGGFRRKLQCLVARESDQHPHVSRLIRGTIPRSFWDAYAAPPDAETLQDLHGRLGKFYDLAIALTMIAGLLNILAIWDAIEGPAYGFGDEVPATEAAGQTAPATATAPSREPATGSIR
jgi:hypothetical protein